MTSRLLVCASLFLSLLMLSPQAHAMPENIVQVNVTEGDNGIFVVKGMFIVPAEVAFAWTVLSNYDQLGTYIPTMKSSIVKKPGTPGLFVAQETTAYFLSIPKTTRVVLKIEESPGSEINFTDVAQEDFDLFKGAWKIKETEGFTQVSYEASAKPKMNIPFWGKTIFSDTVRNLLSDLRREMVRRKTAASG